MTNDGSDHLNYMTRWQAEKHQKEVVTRFKKGRFVEPDKKQNPAFGGICCSQLVLVTQTLPNRSRCHVLKNRLSGVSPFILFREVEFFLLRKKHCSKSRAGPLTVPVKTGISVQPASINPSFIIMYSPVRD